MDRIVRLTGEIDCASSPSVESELMQALSDSGMDVIADLAGVSFIDCSGLGSLLAVGRWATERGLRLRLARPSPAVRRLLNAVDPQTLDAHALDLLADAADRPPEDAADRPPEDAADRPPGDLARSADADAEFLAPVRPMRPFGDVDDDMSYRLDEASEELRVADEELRAQQELIDGLLRDRSAERLAEVRLMAALPIAVVETDRDGRVLQANPAAAMLLRVESSRLRGKPFAVLVEPADRRPLRSAMARVVGGGGTERLAVFLTPRRHGAVPVEMAVIGGGEPPPTGPAGGVASVRGAGRDVPAVRFVIVPHGSAGSGPDAALLEAMGSLSTLSAAQSDLRLVLSRIAELAVASIGPAVAASLTVGSLAEPAILVSTDKLALDVITDQLVAGAGPSSDAYVSRAPVTSLTMHDDERWPALRAKTPAAIDGVAAIPLSGGGEVAGVLTLYGTLGVAAPAAVQRAGLFADAATALLREHYAVAELRHQEAQLRDALTSRAVIDQAKGVLMARRGIDAEAAFAELVAQSHSARLKVREVARRLVADASAVRAPAHGSDATA